MSNYPQPVPTRRMPFPPAVIMGDAITTGNPDLLIGKFIYKPLTTKELFNRYYAQWEEEIGFYSSSRMYIENENFKAIVGMGELAVPFILEKIKEGPTFLVFALNRIFGRRISEFPISLEEAGELWLKELTV